MANCADCEQPFDGRPWGYNADGERAHVQCEPPRIVTPTQKFVTRTDSYGRHCPQCRTPRTKGTTIYQHPDTGSWVCYRCACTPRPDATRSQPRRASRRTDPAPRSRRHVTIIDVNGNYGPFEYAIPEL